VSEQVPMSLEQFAMSCPDGETANSNSSQKGVGFLVPTRPTRRVDTESENLQMEDLIYKTNDAIPIWKSTTTRTRYTVRQSRRAL
jgi:hypothetical protein